MAISIEYHARWTCDRGKFKTVMHGKCPTGTQREVPEGGRECWGKACGQSPYLKHRSQTKALTHTLEHPAENTFHSRNDTFDKSSFGVGKACFRVAGGALQFSSCLVARTQRSHRKANAETPVGANFFAFSERANGH